VSAEFWTQKSIRYVQGFRHGSEQDFSEKGSYEPIGVLETRLCWNTFETHLKLGEIANQINIDPTIFEA